jgi:hypothetical protein
MIDINVILGISLAILAFTAVCLLIVVVPVALQCHRTLNSAQHLIDVINDDLEPALKDIKCGVNNVKNVVNKYSGTAKSVIDNAGIAIVSTSHGLMTGIKSYLEILTSTKGSNNGRKK